MKFLVLTLMLWAQTSMAAQSSRFADVEIKLSEKLSGKTGGIRTLFISIYDAGSKQPGPPFGAMKLDLAKDAEGVVFKGELNANNVMIMGDAAKTPAQLRIKARLDKDGSAGGDEAGDLVGIVESVKTGEKVTIVIDRAI